MFSGILSVKTDKEWMLTRTQKATLTLEDWDLLIRWATRIRRHIRLVCLRTYIVVIGDSSKLELEEFNGSSSGLIDLPIRGYLAVKATSHIIEGRGP